MSIAARALRSTLYATAAAAVLLLAGGGLAAFDYWLFLHLPSEAGRETHQLNIPNGMSAEGVARLLREKGVVSNGVAFRALCRLSGSDQKLRAGEYRFSSWLTPAQVLDKIVQGKGVVHRVTFPEGSTVRNVASILAGEGLASEEEVLRLASDQEFARSLGVDASSLEGRLFPETYYFEKSQSAADILRSMTRQFQRHFPDAWRMRAAELGLSAQQVVALASMVEKEAKIDAERPLVSAVFHNRLRLHMPLQSDPTAVYDLPGFSGPILRMHLERESPYNTYRNIGLPVGPICNPGAKSLEAALYPADVPFLYFVSDNNGAHRFSTNLTEHRQAVSLYREKRNMELSRLRMGEDVKAASSMEGAHAATPCPAENFGEGDFSSSLGVDPLMFFLMRETRDCPLFAKPSAGQESWNAGGLKTPSDDLKENARRNP